MTTTFLDTDGRARPSYLGTRTVFLDRDGTVCEDQVHAVDIARLRLMPYAREAVTLWKSVGWSVVLVTNQSAIARGKYDEAAMRRFHDALEDELGVRFDGIYHCPHLPDAGCACRKPKPGMLQRAARERGIDLPSSFVVGDSWRDVAAGAAAGTWTALVPRGNEDYDNECEAGVGRVVTPDQEARHLLAAAEWTLASSAHHRKA